MLFQVSSYSQKHFNKRVPLKKGQTLIRRMRTTLHTAAEIYSDVLRLFPIFGHNYRRKVSLKLIFGEDLAYTNYACGVTVNMARRKPAGSQTSTCRH